MVKPRDIKVTLRADTKELKRTLEEAGRTKSVPRSQNEPDHDGISRWDPTTFVQATGNAIVSRDSSACYLTVRAGVNEFVASGGAKRNKGERFDFGVGRDLAVGRALMNAGRELERRAMAKVKENEVENDSQWGDGFSQRYIVGAFGQRYIVGADDARWVAAQLTDLPEPTREELEADIAGAKYADITAGWDPDAPQNTPLDSTPKRLLFYDRIKELWK